MFRAINAQTGLTREEICKSPQLAHEKYGIRGKLHVVDDVTMSIDRLDAYCRKHKPDILVVDQLDKVKVNGNYEQSHERLRDLYVNAREIAKKYNISVVGLSQASAEAEGKVSLSFSSMENSKTGKAAEADLIIGIGRYAQEGKDEEDLTRIMHISKNKLTGWHGNIVCVLNNQLSRYEA